MRNEYENVQKDLENILKNIAQSQNIKSYEIFANNNRTQGEGLLSEFFTGEVLNKDSDKTIQVAIKKAFIDGFSVGFGKKAIYKTEIYFYSKVFPELDKFQKEKKLKSPFNHIPKYLGGDADSHNLFVAMENLKTAGYVLFDKNTFFDSEHIELIFKTYGKLHALSFSFKQKNLEGYKNLMKNFTNIIEKFTESELITHMEKSYLTALETFNPVTEADILAKLETAGDVRTTVKNLTYKGCYECLIHGDCWSNNMLFKYKESGELEDIKLIDFQLSCSSTPIFDLSFFFYSGASKIDMDQLDYYLDLYYQSFSNFARKLEVNPEEIYPLDILKKEWKQYGIWGIYKGCQLWVVKLMNQDEIKNVLNQKGLPEAKYWDLLNEKMSTILEGPDYRERARNICLHAVEYGVI